MAPVAAAAGAGRKRAASAAPLAAPSKRSGTPANKQSADAATDKGMGGGGAPPTVAHMDGGGAPHNGDQQGGGGAPPEGDGSHNTNTQGSGGALPVQRGGGTPMDATLANHPTIQHLMKEVLPLIDPLMAELEDADPVAHGGIAAFDREDYTRGMNMGGCYECHVTIAWLDIFSYVHKTVVPAWGSVLRIYHQFFHDPATGAPTISGPLCTVHVRATSTSEPPQKGGLQRLDNDAYLMAFLHAWAESTRHGTTDQFRQAATRMRVGFMFLPDADTAERRKWILMEAARSSSENQLLFGVKRAHAVFNLQQELKARGARHDAEALAGWFTGIKFCHAEDTMTKGSIDRQLKIFSRMSADQRIMDALEKMESMYGRRHALASSSALDIMCNRTAMKGNTPLQTALSVFIAEAVMVMHARGDLPLETSRDTLGGKVIPQVLLKRRVIFYLASKFRFADRPAMVPADRTASVVLLKVFGSFATFHACFPKGRTVSDTPAQDGGGDANCAPDGQLWIAHLLPCRQNLLEFIKDMCGSRADIDAAVKAACARDQSVAAESFMARDDVRDIFNVHAFSDVYADETRAHAPRVVHAPGEAVAEPPSEEAAEPPSEAAAEPHSKPECDEGVPTTTDEVTAASRPHPADEFFPLLHVGRVMRDKLQKVDHAVLQAMHEHAAMRVATYVELKVRPADNANLTAAVQEFSLFQQARDATDRRIIWSYDCKCWMDNTNADAVRYGYRQLPEFDERDFTSVCETVFGVKDSPSRFDTCLFQVRDLGANDLMIVFDGRRSTTLDRVDKIFKASLKGETQCFAAKLCMPVRLMHTNSQFNGILRRSSGDAVHTSLPDPLESFGLVFCKSFRLREVPRMFCDLPGTSRTRGLNQVPPRDSLEMTAGVTVKQKRLMLDSVSFRRGPWLADDSCGIDFDVDDTDQPEPEQPVAQETLDSCIVPLFTWENSEVLWRELLNMYRPQGSVGGVVDFTAGSGLAALAAARHKIMYAGFARMSDHVAFVHSFLILMIVGELIDGKSDGFMLRKFLSRQPSLGGGRASGLDRAPQPYAVAAVAAVEPVAAGASESDSSESES